MVTEQSQPSGSICRLPHKVCLHLRLFLASCELLILAAELPPFPGNPSVVRTNGWDWRLVKGERGVIC